MVWFRVCAELMGLARLLKRDLFEGRDLGNIS